MKDFDRGYKGEKRFDNGNSYNSYKKGDRFEKNDRYGKNDRFEKNDRYEKNGFDKDDRRDPGRRNTGRPHARFHTGEGYAPSKDFVKAGPRPARPTANIPPAMQVGAEEKSFDKPYRKENSFRKEKSFRENRSFDRENAPFRKEDAFREEKPFREERSFRNDKPASQDELPENLLVGRNPIREALRADAPIDKLLVAAGDLSGAAQDIVRLAKEKGVVVQTVERSRLDAIYPAHQGLLAWRAMRDYAKVDDIFALAEERGEEPFIVLLDGITDPHNLGAIARSAECAGAHGVIVPERRAVGLTPACEKAAAGALNHLPVAKVKNLNRTIEELKERGVWIVAAALDGEDALDCDMTGPICLVIGSEGDGISRLTLEKCDRRVTLPMKGKIESLNASVAAGILLYQVLRARKS